MKTRNIMRHCTAFTLGILLLGKAHAADVLFVDTAATVHPSWQELIESEGHTFTRYDTTTYSISLANQESIDHVNSFDVIIISGSNALFNSIRTHGAIWNAQPTPMINLGNFLVSGQFSSTTWRWTTPGNGTTPNRSTPVDVLDEDDPIWTGVPLTPGTPPTVDLHSVNAGHLALGTNTFLSNITTVAAQSSNNGEVAIAYAAPEALRAGGGPQYFISSMTGGDGQAVPFTDEGKQVFLNAIAALTGGFAPDGPFPVTITRNSDTPGTYDFEWESRSGKLYDLLTSIDLATPVASWPVYEVGETVYGAIPSAGETTTLTAVPSGDPSRFFVVREYDAPPPPPLLFADFEENDGGFTVVTTGAGSAWAHGKPASADLGGGFPVDSGSPGSLEGAWGVNLLGAYAAATVTALRSPVLDLTGVTGAQLRFFRAFDMAEGDSLVVRVIEDDSDNVLGDPLLTVNGPASSNWQEAGPFVLPAEALDRPVRIEWSFTGTADDSNYLGVYIDDVLLEPTSP